MDLEDVFHEVNELLEDENYEEAEELLVSFAEQPDVYKNWACSFINTLVYSILIPQGRFREAYAWLDDSIQGDYGYETWNSISNLGHVLLRLGNIERAEKLFNIMKEAGTGPLDEAYEFLEMIESGDAEDLDAGTEDPRETKAYKHFYEYLLKNGLDESAIGSFRSSRGGATHGFVQGILSSEKVEFLEPTSDAIAQLLWDYITQEVFDELPSYEQALEAAKSGRAQKSHRRVLREEAFEGSGEAAYWLYESLKKEPNLNSLPWLSVAESRGYRLAQTQSTQRQPKMF